jgi:hypothetical protein
MATGEITAVLRNTQEMSVTQKNGKQWAVRFSNSTSTGNTFRTWSGLSFASSTPQQTYKLRSGVSFGNPTTGNDLDIVFSPITGELPQNQIITLLAGTVGSAIKDIIVNPFGKVTTRTEEGLVGYWHFDEGTSTIAYDVSGYGNNGTLANGPTWQPDASCKSGKCLSFDGLNDYINAGSSVAGLLNGVSELSVSGWFKLNTVNADDGLFAIRVSGDGDWFWNIRPGGSYFWIGYKTSNGTGYREISNPFSGQSGNWIFLVTTYSSGSLKTYKNGILIDTATITGSVSVDISSILEIGGYATPGSYTPNGIIDEFRIYDRALSATEVLQMYNDLR